MKTSTLNKKSTADKFSAMFDQDWSKTKSRIRDRFDEKRTYDVTNSWDARSDNPKSFARLEQTLVPFQNSCPIVLSGAAVVELEDNRGFNSINVKQPKHERCAIPLTVEQQDVNMAPDLSAHVPIAENAKRTGKHLVMEKAARFENMALQPPVYKEVTLPEYVQRAGPQRDQLLMNPHQRREVYDIDRRVYSADKAVRDAQSDRIKTK